MPHLTLYHVLIRFFENAESGLNRPPSGYIWKENNSIEGDLPGILKRLDYLKDIGVNALWLSPLHPCRTTHGYDVENYFDLDPYQVPGRSREERLHWFQDFIRRCHQVGIRVLMDLVLNHVSHRFSDPHSRARLVGATNRQEREWSHTFRFFHKTCPRTEEYLLHVGEFWLQQGVDGFRLDYVLGRSRAFWKRFNTRMRKINPACITIGEAWETRKSLQKELKALYQHASFRRGRSFNGVFDFAWQKVLREALTGHRSMRDLLLVMQEQSRVQAGDFHPVAFLENHDMRRLMDWPGMNPRLFLAAMTLFLTHPASICLEYGTELMLQGDAKIRKKEESGRVPMPWNQALGPRGQTFAHMMRIRNQSRALKHGTRRLLYASDSQLFWEQSSDQDGFLVLVSRETFRLSTTLGRDLFSGQVFEAGMEIPAGGYLFSKN